MNAPPWQPPPKANLDRIPPDLKALPQWVSVGPNKVPLNPATGIAASVTDPQTWGRFEDAVRAGRPIGFVLTRNDPYCIIDLDNKPEKPLTPEEWAVHERILSSFPTYKERSIGGRGYHLVLRGSVPGGGMRRGNVEVYSANRYMIFTGDVDEPLPIVDCQERLMALAGEIGPPSPHAVEDYDADEVSDDKELLERALGASNGEKFNMLSQGRWHECTDPTYPSQSEADFALVSMLAFYTRNNEQIRRLFRMSMLGKRDKATDKYIDRMISRIRGNEPPPVEVSLSPPAFVLGKSAQSSQGSPFRVAAAPVTVDGETLLAQTFKPVQWAIYGIVPEGRTLLTGDPKIGKSWLGYQLCIAVATGSPLYPGAKPEVVGVALYLALEDNQRRVQSRLKKLIPHFSKRTETGFGAPSLEKLHVVCDWPRGVEGVRRLAEWLREHPDCRLVVIDTLAAFRSIEGGNKTAYRDDYELGEILKPLTTEFSVAIVLIGHNRKMQAGDVLQMVSGTQGLTGGVDNVIVMRRERGSMDAGLYVDGRDIEDPKEYALRFNNCLWRITGSVAEAQRSKERQAILEAVEELGEAAQPKEIATLLGKNGGAVRKLLHSMVADGELRNEGGVYAHPKS